MHRERFLGHIDRFLADDANGQALKEMIKAETDTLTKKEKAQIFRNISANKGIGKPHASQYQAPQYEGQPKRS